MTNFLTYFKAALIVQLFWSVSVTLLVASMPTSDLTYLNFTTQDTSVSAINTAPGQVESALDTSTNLPVVDSATLIFYSGNLMLDLIVNFVTAIPQMFTLLLTGFFTLFPIELGLQKEIRTATYAFIAVLYFFSLAAFITNMRSGSNVI